MLRVVEVFPSIQGEGIYIGTPMTFIRLAGCNLRCKWCDTKYALVEGRPYDEELLVKLIGCYHVCITGGEPLLQDITKLVDLLHYRQHYVHIETNGTIVPETVPDVDFWSISPKLTNSGMRDRWTTETLVELIEKIEQKPAHLQLKFVIEREDDMLEAMRIVEDIEDHLGDAFLYPIIFQPEGSCAPKSTNRYSNALGTSLFSYIKKLKMMTKIIEVHSEKFSTYDVRILPQLHVIIWGKQRGR